MISFLQKYFPFILITIVVAFINSLVLYPAVSSWLNILLLISSLGLAFFFAIQKHMKSFKQGQLTRIKFTRNVLLDILGLLFTIAAASYLGSLAGMRLGASFGLWVGLIAGMTVGFMSAWGVRKVWGGLVATT